MPLPTPNLDDRKFQDIFDEARRLIPIYCPEWTNHNLNDPGITLLELFAFMTDLILYRLNRIPDRNYVKFMELIGLHLEPARAATVDLTFRLTTGQPVDVTIPRGTSVGTVRTQTRASVTFVTDADLIIPVPDLGPVLACRAGSTFFDYRPALGDSRNAIALFSDPPQPDDGIYLGFNNDLGGHVLDINLRCQRSEGVGIDPRDPPLVWETWDRLAQNWVPLRLEVDTTAGLNQDGIIVVDLPNGAAPVAVFNQTALWVRGRVVARPGQHMYAGSPRISRIEVTDLGGVVSASHGARVSDEVLGISEGSPGQRFTFTSLPVLPRREGETLEVAGADGQLERWVEVPDFAASGPDDRHYVIDDVAGSLELGPRIRSPRGEERQYGQVPPAGSKLRFSNYRSGGGVAGNVGAQTLTVLQASIPYVAWVTNFAPALGGTDPEDLEHARLRAPRMLRSSERAVTAEDFELLARQASPAVGRARCLVARDDTAPAATSGGPGVVRVQLIPALEASDQAVPAAELALSERLLQEVGAFLDDRRLLTCELRLEAPAYTWVSIDARVRARTAADTARLADRAARALYRFVHPTRGGPDGQGWPFGRALFQGDIFAVLQAVDGVDVVEEVGLHSVDQSTGQVGPAVTQVAATDDGVVCSYEHHVVVD